MVRTYAFNPSISTEALATAGLPPAVEQAEKRKFLAEIQQYQTKLLAQKTLEDQLIAQNRPKNGAATNSCSHPSSSNSTCTCNNRLRNKNVQTIIQASDMPPLEALLPNSNNSVNSNNSAPSTTEAQQATVNRNLPANFKLPPRPTGQNQNQTCNSGGCKTLPMTKQYWKISEEYLAPKTSRYRATDQQTAYRASPPVLRQPSVPVRSSRSKAGAVPNGAVMPRQDTSRTVEPSGAAAQRQAGRVVQQANAPTPPVLPAPAQAPSPSVSKDDSFIFGNNSQPKSGVRGSPQWFQYQPGAKPNCENTLPRPASLPTVGQSISNTLAAACCSGTQCARQIESRGGEHLNESRLTAPLLQNKGDTPPKMSFGGQNRPSSPEYDPWGKGGGGAPLRDRQGRMVADRRKMAASWKQSTDTNQPHSFDFNAARQQEPSQPGLGALYGGSGGIGPGAPSAAMAGPIDYGSIDLFAGGGGISDPINYGSLSSTSMSQPLHNGSMNNAASFSPSVGSGLGAPQQQGRMTERDFYKVELQKQIEEKKARERAERDLERAEEDKARRRAEQHAAQVQAELQSEKKRAQDRAADAERKRVALAEKARVRDCPQDQIERDRQNKRGGGAAPAASSATYTAPAQNDGLEWWERRPPVHTHSGSVHGGRRGQQQRQTTAQDDQQGGGAKARNGRPFVESPPPVDKNPSRSTRRTAAPDSSAGKPPKSTSSHTRSRGRSGSIDSQLDNENSKYSADYRPSSSQKRNETILRQLSAMRERLAKENVRVRTAIRRNEYNEDVFSDEDSLPVSYLQQRERSRRHAKESSHDQRRHNQSSDRHSRGAESRDEDTRQSSRHRPPTVDSVGSLDAVRSLTAKGRQMDLAEKSRGGSRDSTDNVRTSSKYHGLFDNDSLSQQNDPFKGDQHSGSSAQRRPANDSKSGRRTMGGFFSDDDL